MGKLKKKLMEISRVFLLTVKAGWESVIVKFIQDGEAVLLHVVPWPGGVQGVPLHRDPLHPLLNTQPHSSGCGKVCY